MSSLPHTRVFYDFCTSLFIVYMEKHIKSSCISCFFIFFNLLMWKTCYSEFLIAFFCSLYGATMTKSMKTRFSSHFLCCFCMLLLFKRQRLFIIKKEILYSFCCPIKVEIITIFRRHCIRTFFCSLTTLWLFKTCKASELNKNFYGLLTVIVDGRGG